MINYGFPLLRRRKSLKGEVDQLMRIMKLLSLLLFWTSMHLSATTFSQTVTLKVKKQSLSQVLMSIKQQTGYHIIYNDRYVNPRAIVSVQATDRPLEEVLNKLLTPQSLTYYMKDNTIVIRPLESNALSLDGKNHNAQQKTISGKVTDEAGEPLEGVTVAIKGTAVITTTSVDGQFQLTGESTATTLVFTAIGFERREMPVADQTALNVVLKAAMGNLDEVVVVGYGTQRRRDITGAVSSVDEKALREMPTTNAQQMLQGRVSGVYVTQGANKPGAEPSVRVRGNRSFQGGNNPLYVVDGIPISGGFNDINPTDIVAMEVLKDASATAIYGSRGANGVILITTRRGTEGTPTLNYNNWFGPTKIVRYADVFDGPDFVEFKREANRARGDYDDSDPEGSDARIFEPGELENIHNGRYTDWPDMITQDGFSHNHELSVLGGTPQTKYNVSLGYFNDKGYFDVQDYTRYTARVNLDQRVGKRFNLGVSVLGSYNERNGGSINPYMASLVQTPLGYPYDDQGNLVPFPTGDALMYNLLANFVPGAVINKEKRFRMLTSMFGEVELAEGLKFRTNFGPDLINSRTGNFQASNTTSRQGGLPAASSSESFVFSYTWENILTYDKTFAEKHRINITGLHSIQERTLESSNINVTDLPAESVQYYNLGAANEILGVGSNYEKWTILSYMGRINYSFDDRFLLTLTGRADGSSRFAPNNKWGFFPSAAFAYNLSDEEFIQGISFLNNLKLRVSYGKVGNTGIDPYRTQGLLETTRYDFNGEAAFGRRPNSIANPELRWETSATANIGVDFGLFNNRINGTVELYHTKTTDLLLGRLLPITTGFGEVTTNIGRTQNRGFEVSLTTQNVTSRTDGFEWATDLNVAYNEERIVELSQGKQDDIGNLWFIGQPQNVFFDYQKLGIWQLGQEEEAAQYSSSVGQIRVADRNGNGVIDPDDRMILGVANPPWTFGFNNRFSYKGFDLSVFVVARSGNMIASSLHSVPNNSIALGGRYNMLNVDYWTPENPTNAYPRPLNGQSGNPGPVFGSTLKYFDGSFIRVRNINLGYSLPNGWADKIKAHNARLTFTVTNPFIFSSFVRDHNGIDPEVMDNPAVVQYLFGVNVSF